jgi:hypothetical protein
VINKDLAEEIIFVEGVGPRESEPDERIFERTCLNWINNWLLVNDAQHSNQGACVFLFNPKQKPESLLNAGIRQFKFISSFPVKVEGHIYACATGMNVVFRDNVPGIEFDVPDVLGWASVASLDHCLVIVFYPRLRQIYTKPIGVSIKSDDDVSYVQLPKPKDRFVFDFQKLDHVLEFFYDHAVKTHLAACRIWKDPKKRTLVTYPEDMVHRSLFLTFLTYIDFNGAGKTNIEVHNVSGRMDIQIIVNDGGKFSLGIIELKVLFPSKPDAWNSAWALAGIKQADDYRSATTLQKVECAYTCLYDGRKQDQAMPNFFKEAVYTIRCTSVSSSSRRPPCCALNRI